MDIQFENSYTSSPSHSWVIWLYNLSPLSNTEQPLLLIDSWRKQKSPFPDSRETILCIYTYVICICISYNLYIDGAAWFCNMLNFHFIMVTYPQCRRVSLWKLSVGILLISRFTVCPIVGDKPPYREVTLTPSLQTS